MIKSEVVPGMLSPSEQMLFREVKINFAADDQRARTVVDIVDKSQDFKGFDAKEVRGLNSKLSKKYDLDMLELQDALELHRQRRAQEPNNTHE